MTQAQPSRNRGGASHIWVLCLFMPIYLFTSKVIPKSRLTFSSLSIMDRYMTIEITLPFLFSVSLFSALGVAIGTLTDLVNKIVEFNLPLETALQVLMLKLPEFTAYALPISVLLSTLMAYGRLSSDSETVALRGCGVSVYRLVAPALVLSLVITGVTFLFNELVVPAANYQATLLQAKYVGEEPFPQTRDIFYPEYGASSKLKLLFYAEEFDGEAMRNLTILIWSQGGLDRIITSNSATWNPVQKHWDFFNGTVYQVAANASFEQISHFDHQQLSLSQAPFDLASKYRDPYEMNVAQAWEYVKLLRSSGDEKRLLMFEVRTQQKLAFPFVCLVFGLVGSALGIRPRSVGKATSFGLCVAIVFAYYLLGFMIGGFGIAGIISPIFAAWLPNFLGLGVGGVLLARATW